MSHKFNAIVDKYGGLGKRVVGNMNFLDTGQRRTKPEKFRLTQNKAIFFQAL